MQIIPRLSPKCMPAKPPNARFQKFAMVVDMPTTYRLKRVMMTTDSISVGRAWSVKAETKENGP